MQYGPLEDFRSRAEVVGRTLKNDSVTFEIYNRVIEEIDVDRVRELQEKYASELVDFHPSGIYKYADLPYWIAHKIGLAREIGLDRSDPKVILDLGMGAGHFAAVCRALGHRVVGTDISVPVYDDICTALGVDRRIQPTRHRTPLVDLGETFDLVTIIWQVFHIIRQLPDGTRQHWSTDDWRYFLEDLVSRHMRRPGEIFMSLNPIITAQGTHHDQALIRWFHGLGAQVQESNGRVRFSGVTGWDSRAGPILTATSPTEGATA